MQQENNVVEIEEWDHSPLGPSASERWMNCLGSVLATIDMEDQSSEYAIEGTAGHTVTEWCRNEGKPAKDYLGVLVRVKLAQKDKKGNALFQDVEVDQEMVDAVQTFLDYVDALPGDVFVEERVSYTEWVKDGFGTSDDIRIADKLCNVTDYKHGKGIQVFAPENPQLKLYALGVYHDYGHLYDIDNFRLNICQPRLNHVDEWEISLEDLLEWAEEEVRPVAEIAMQPGAPFKAGDWCRFCLLKDECKTRGKAVFEAAVGDFDDLDAETPVETIDANRLTLEEIGLMLPFLPFIKSFCEDLDKHALSEIGKGKTIPHPVTGDYKLVEGRSNRIWKNKANEGEDRDAAIVRLLRRAKMKVADIFTKNLKGPAAIEKVIGKKVLAELELVEKPPGKPKLVPGTDKRPTLEIKAEDEFDPVEEVEE